MDINENIKTLCKIRGLSFAALADRLKITRQTLYRQSTGAAQLSTIERIAEALQVPPFILLHPSPAAALVQIRTAPEDRTGDATRATSQDDTNQAPPLLCPICGSRLQIQIRPEERSEKAHDPKTKQDSKGQTNGRTKRQDQETSPEGLKRD